MLSGQLAQAVSQLLTGLWEFNNGLNGTAAEYRLYAVGGQTDSSTSNRVQEAVIVLTQAPTTSPTFAPTTRMNDESMNLSKTTVVDIVVCV